MAIFDRIRNMTPQQKQRWGNALYLIGGELKGDNMSENVAMLQQGQQLRTARDKAAKLNASIDNNPNLSLTREDVIKALKNDPTFSTWDYSRVT